MSMQDEDQGQPDIPALREAAKRGESAAKRADEAERKLALVEAGVDTKSPVGKLFTEAYKGPLDEDSIKAAWSELAQPAGSTPPPPAEPAPTPPTPTPTDLEETEARRLLTSAGAGDTPNETPPPDPIESGYEEFHQRMKDGDTRIKASGSVFGALFKAASEGDDRATWSGWTEEQIREAKG